MISSFKEQTGDTGGLEVYYLEYTKEQQESLRKLAKEYDLKLSGGSDFHGSNKPHIKLGSGMGHLFVPYDLLTNLRPS